MNSHEQSQMAQHRLLTEGWNCWRLTRVQRAAFLIDGAAYFAAFAAAAEQAQESIFIVGWDVDSRVRLLPDDPDPILPVELGPFLKALVSRRRRLHVYVLNWDFAVVFALEREPLPMSKLGWWPHRRVHFRMDGEHPVGASHHQKIVVVDDAIAFVGGIDLAIRRWDTPEHHADDPRRLDPRGQPYAPMHDVQMAVDGEAAAALGELVRERWQRATGHRIGMARQPRRDPWPALHNKPCLHNKAGGCTTHGSWGLFPHGTCDRRQLISELKLPGLILLRRSPDYLTGADRSVGRSDLATQRQTAAPLKAR